MIRDFRPADRDFGGAGHALPDRMLSAALVAQLEAEAMGDAWMAIVLRQDGKFHYKASPGAETWDDPDLEEKLDFMRRLVRALNRDATELGGAWVVALTAKARKFVWIWKDPDGDKNIVLYDDEPWSRIKRENCHVDLMHWIDDAVAAMRKWALIHGRLLRVRPEEQYRKALGERPPPRAH